MKMCAQALCIRSDYYSVTIEGRTLIHLQHQKTSQWGAMVSEMPGTDAQHHMISLQCSIWTLTSQQELSTVMLLGTHLFGSKSGG